MKKMLKVRPAQIPPKKSPISLRLPVPTIMLLKLYLKAYATLYGMEPDQDFITNEILLNFFNSDKEFMVYVKENGFTHTEGTAQQPPAAGGGRSF
jgi:hypothetical protein